MRQFNSFEGAIMWASRLGVQLCLTVHSQGSLVLSALSGAVITVLPWMDRQVSARRVRLQSLQWDVISGSIHTYIHT